MVDKATEDWRIRVYSGVPSLAWAGYAYYKNMSWRLIFIRYLAGAGVGYTAAYMHNYSS